MPGIDIVEASEATVGKDPIEDEDNEAVDAIPLSCAFGAIAG